MILKFTFNLPSNQGIVEKILIRNAKDLKLGLSRDLENLYAFIEGEEDKIEEFSRNIANEIPMSIFLKSLDAEVVDEFKDDLNRNFPNISLPPCPKCLREVKDEENEHYFDIFHHCEVCGYRTSEELRVENGEWDFNKKEDRRKFFENLAKKLESGNIYIQTMNGAYEISKDLKNAEFVMAKDLASISKYFMAFEGDAKALASIEKPFIKLKTNIEFKKVFNSSIPAFYVKLPDCMVTEFLFEVSDFELLGFRQTNNPKDLEFNVEVEKPLFAVVTDAKDILIESGDRGIIPAFEKDIGVDGKYKDYGYKNGVIDKLKNLGEINSKETKPTFSGFYGVLEQWNLRDKNIMGFCFYEDENKILINSPKFGLIEYIDFKFDFENFEEIFAQITIMNETGPKLIKNFKEKRPEFFENALNASIKSDKKGIYYLWGLIAIVLGMAKNIDDGFREILKHSNEAMTKKGPRIDYKMDGNNLNPLWAIRTAMSFHLAGVDNYLLSYGVVESFAEFLSNQYDSFHKDNDLDGAIIVGDLFRGEFLNKIYSYIDKNYKVYTPRALQISGGIEAFGNAVINKEAKN